MANAITDSTIILGLITGKASGSLVGDLALIASEPGDLIAGINSTNYISDDGPNATTLAHGSFIATQYLVMLVQTDISESKKRVGFFNGGFTWSSWGTFDNSFDLMVYLDVLVNSETMTLNGMSIYNELASEADIRTEINLLKISPSALGIGMTLTGHNMSLSGQIGARGFHGFNV
jgi:hypothetical protein